MNGLSIQMIFSPQNCTLERLDATLTSDRRALADDIISSLRTSFKEKSSRNHLIIGPRGSGKTHILAYIRKSLEIEQKNPQDAIIISLSEEERGMISLFDFITTCLRAAAVPNDSLLSRITNSDPAFALDQARDLFNEITKDKPVLIILENLSDIFSRLGDNTIPILRGFLQNHPNISLLASSVRLYPYSSKNDHPFYGYFLIHPLQPLDEKEAGEYLKMLAEENSDHKLAKALGEKSSQHRLKTIYHLTGGNHRLLAMLSTFLTVNGLSELVDPFVQMADRELTPYYQQRLDRLSPQQYKIIQLIADQHGQALRVNDIASRIFLSPQIVSRQLHDVLHEGYVRRNSIGRESYYELNEPLLRLILDIKQGRDRPLPIIVNFLQNWYNVEELRQLEACAPESARLYYQAALEQIKFKIFQTDLLPLKPSIEDVLPNIDKAIELFKNSKFAESLNILEDILNTNPKCNIALKIKMMIMFITKRWKEVFNIYEKISLDFREFMPSIIKYAVSLSKSAISMKNGNLSDALKHCEEAMQFLPNEHGTKLIYADILFNFHRDDEGFCSLKNFITNVPLNDPKIIDVFASFLSEWIENDTIIHNLFSIFDPQNCKILQQGLQLWIQKQIPLSPEKADKLGKVYQALQSIFGDVPEMKPIIALLRAAQGYSLGDKKALMDIPLELRQLIAPDFSSASA